MNGLTTLLFPKIRSGLNSTLRTPRGIVRAVVVVGVAAAFWFGIYSASYWFVDQCQRVEVFGDILVENLLSMSLLVVFTVLVFSNLVASFSTMFLADDLKFLMSRPLRPYTFYSARFIEQMFQSGWMVGIFSLAFFMSLGAVYDAGFGFTVRLLLMLAPLFVIATALAAIVSLILTNVLPARRTRDILLLVMAFVFVTLFVTLRALKPERFLDPDERAGMVEVLSALSAPRLSVLPSEWAHRELWPSISGLGETNTLYMGLLYATAAALFFIGGWIFRGMHFDGYSKAAEGRHDGAAPERLVRRIFRGRTPARERGERLLNRLASQPGKAVLTRQIRLKDAKTFIRDTTQWTQLVLLAALVAIYLLNFRYIRTLGEGGIISPTGLYFTNLGLAGFVVTAICVRFVFPLVSLEGRSFWLVRSAPVTTIEFLRAKWLSSGTPIWAFGLMLTLASCGMLEADASLVVIAAVLETPITFGVVGLGIGIGATFPRFDETNAAKIATGVGGFMYMVFGIVLTLTCVGLSVHPTLTLQSALEGEPVSAERWALAGGLALAAISLPLIASSLAMRFGARRLDRGL